MKNIYMYIYPLHTRKEFSTETLASYNQRQEGLKGKVGEKIEE